MNLRQLIIYSLNTLLKYSNSEDIEIFNILILQGIDKNIAKKIIQFVPLAFCRVILESSGIVFSNYYQVSEYNGEISELRPLQDEEVFNEAIAIAIANSSSLCGDELLVIAGRSAEFNVINELLNEGAFMNELELIPTLMLPFPNY